jgi:hypothetical protein
MLLKRMRILILSLLLILVEFLLKADNSNGVYVVDDGHLMEYHINNQFMISPELIAAAKTNKECLPAQDFPAGNWGAVESGYQLSLRFEKPIFTNGEPIEAIVLLRNVTNNAFYLQYDQHPVGYSDGPIGFCVERYGGGAVPQHVYSMPPIQSMDGNTRWLVSSTQAKYLERLDQRFALTNGTYTVQAVKTALCAPWPQIKTNGFGGGVPFTVPVLDFSRQKKVEVKSGIVIIKIQN